MIPNDQPLRKEIISKMLYHLERYASEDDCDLTQWESSFIESIKEQFEEKGDLSNKQCEILERFYDK